MEEKEEEEEDDNVDGSHIYDQKPTSLIGTVLEIRAIQHINRSNENENENEDDDNMFDDIMRRGRRRGGRAEQLTIKV